MWWFNNKEKPGDIWDEAIEWPLGDIEAAEKIRNICRAAAESAVVVAGGTSGAGKNRAPVPKNFEVENERYQRAAKTAMEIALKISDDLMRDAGVREIVELCLKANDVTTARILARAILSPAIREPMLADHPPLRQ